MMQWATFISSIMAFLITVGQGNVYPTPPLPLEPIPSAFQLAFQQRQLAMFFHFGMNTFTDNDWETGTVDPDVFDPVGLDTDQWMSVAKAAGFKLVILTVKHHDGFCLWPSKYTNYSVASSKWRDGSGDVLGSFVASAAKAGLRVGVYLSPWDRHDESYGNTVLYNEYYLAQVQELLTKYGSISEVFLDGAKGPDALDMDYFFPDWFAVVKQLQPGANIFSDSGPDVRWVGNEAGEGGSTSWAMMNKSQVAIGQSSDIWNYLREGDPLGIDWVPPECSVSIRPRWFWHDYEEPWSLEILIELYYSSVGRNCVLLLNVPPNTTGLIGEVDATRLLELSRVIDGIFSTNLAVGHFVTASSTRGKGSMSMEESPFSPAQVLDDGLDTFWTPADNDVAPYLEFDLQGVTAFNVLKVQEAIQLGQRVSEYRLFVFVNDSWQLVVTGTTIGFKRLSRFDLVHAERARLCFDSFRGLPVISSVGLYHDKVSQAHAKTLSTLNITQHYFKEVEQRAAQVLRKFGE